MDKAYPDKTLTGAAIDDLFFESSIEPFSDAVGLRFSDESKAWSNTPPVFLDPALIASKKYGVRAVPSTYFIDRKGIARNFIVGEVTKEVFDKTVEEML